MTTTVAVPGRFAANIANGLGSAPWNDVENALTAAQDEYAEANAEGAQPTDFLEIRGPDNPVIGDADELKAVHILARHGEEQEQNDTVDHAIELIYDGVRVAGPIHRVNSGVEGVGFWKRSPEISGWSFNVEGLGLTGAHAKSEMLAVRIAAQRSYNQSSVDPKIGDVRFVFETV